MTTIIALSTPPMRSAIAVVRMSGPETFSICEKVFLASGSMEPRKLALGTVRAGGVSDKAMAARFPSPASYTGEDMVEFYLHGSMAVVRALISECIRLGAVQAESGDFTKRAFLNGKLDLAEAEGVIDLIDSETKAQARSAYEHSEGGLSREIDALQAVLTDAIAAAEADIDYPEEDLEEFTCETAAEAADKVIRSADKLLSTYSYGKIIREGVRIALCGAANAGKSSLLNALLGEERAIVTAIAGTTRDTLTESYEYGGMKFVLTDTAGFNDSPGEIEKLGIVRSLAAAKSADIILFLCESGETLPKELLPFRNKVVFVGSKSDILPPSGDISVSAVTGANIDALRKLVFERTAGAALAPDGVLITSARHYEALLAAKRYLYAAKEGAVSGVPASVYLIDLRAAWEALGSITGVTGSAEIVNAVFKRFCVGK